jgi:hypothetical protein
VKSITLGLVLTLCALPVLAQSGAPTQSAATSTTAPASPLDGNWQITGNREHKQYPLISMAIHVNGEQVTAEGDRFMTCPTSPSPGFGGNFNLAGEIGPDSTFTLRTRQTPHPGKPAIQLTIAGKVPAAGSTSWDGKYTISGEHEAPACSLDHTAAFTASRLAPLAGTFSGPLMLGYTGKVLKFTITVEQGEFVSHERKVGPAYTYLPLTGTITVEGLPCFKHGTADASLYNTLQGDLALLRFDMDDESVLSLSAVYNNPDGTGLVVQLAGVRGGTCDKQTFAGVLARR